jgi:drug/metabolite transporter (DMT)-like permease
MERAYLLWPLLAAGLYALAALGLKSATGRGFDAPVTTVLANWVAAAAFLVFVPWHQPAWWPQVWWMPVVEGTVFFLGQVFTVLALTRGDVSIATPLLGTKVVMVAFLAAAFFNVVVGLPVWAGAVCAVAGIAVLQRTGQKGRLQHTVITVVFSLLAALSFGLFDVLNQVWSPHYGYGRVVPPALVWAAVLSVGLLPLGNGRWRAATAAGWWHLALGVGLLTLQSLVLITVIGKVGDAAGCNIVYGTRGLWSVLLVAVVGHWFGNRERHAGRAVMAWRLTGAGLILVGVVLVFVR